jgi:hypothetical protein
MGRKLLGYDDAVKLLGGESTIVAALSKLAGAGLAGAGLVGLAHSNVPAAVGLFELKNEIVSLSQETVRTLRHHLTRLYPPVAGRSALAGLVVWHRPGGQLEADDPPRFGLLSSPASNPLLATGPAPAPRPRSPGPPSGSGHRSGARHQRRRRARSGRSAPPRCPRQIPEPGGCGGNARPRLPQPDIVRAASWLLTDRPVRGNLPAQLLAQWPA